MADTLADIEAQIAELEKRKEAILEKEKQAQMAEKGKAVVAKVAAFKALYSLLNANEEDGGYPDGVPAAWRDTNQQALPRERLIGRRFGLSESETELAKEKGRKAIEEL